MGIKAGKFEVRIPIVLVIFGLLAADSMYANHCRTKTNQALLAAGQTINSDD